MKLMLHVYTVFDYNKKIPQPQVGVAYDGSDIFFYDFYAKDNGLSIKDVQTNKEAYGKLFEYDVFCNDFKSHVGALNLERHTQYSAYDTLRFFNCPLDTNSCKRVLAEEVIRMRDKQPAIWQNLAANASVVYQRMEDTGVRHGYKRVPVTYSLETFTGRSKTLGFNLHGATAEFDIKPDRDANEVQIHFDWVSADLCAAAHISQDPDMLASFKESDPYTVMSDALGYPRDDCKKQLLKAVYSLDYHAGILECYPVFRDWMRAHVNLMRKQGFLTSILGRRFDPCDDHSELAVFNAQFQGSVAHAMQASLVRIHQLYPTYLMAETHDAIILSCPVSIVPAVIKNVVAIMRSPLDGLTDQVMKMAVKVSLGNEWKKWSHYKTFRE